MPGLLDAVAERYDLDPELLHTIARIESGGNPNARTGSYKGLFQLSDTEFNKYGGGDIYSATDNANAAAAKIKAESETFRQQYGRDPTPTDIYMVHQQGPAGYGAHLANPDQPAWQSMLSTWEGQKKGEPWARRAIWGNIPDQYKSQFGNVNNVTSQQFVDMWRQRMERPGAPIGLLAGGEAAPLGGAYQPGMASPVTQPSPLSAASLGARTTPAGVPLTAPTGAVGPQAPDAGMDLSALMQPPTPAPIRFAQLRGVNPLMQFLRRT